MYRGYIHTHTHTCQRNTSKNKRTHTHTLAVVLCIISNSRGHCSDVNRAGQFRPDCHTLTRARVLHLYTG